MATQFVGVPEVAAALGVDQSTIHRWIARQDLTPTLYIGRRPLFSLKDFERIKKAVVK